MGKVISQFITKSLIYSLTNIIKQELVTSWTVHASIKPVDFLATIWCLASVDVAENSILY